jgi:hypothetical protein
VKTPTRNKKRQICHVTAPDFLKELKLAVDVGAFLQQEGKD